MFRKHINTNDDLLAKRIFILSAVLILIVVSFSYGVLSSRYNIFPMPLIKSVYMSVSELLNPSDSILVVETDTTDQTESFEPDQLAPGLIMIVGSQQGTRNTFVDIIDRDGTVIHSWNPRWYEIWSDVEIEHSKFPKGRRPRGGKGMYLHGIDILPDGSFIANFEHLSTFRMDVCGDVMWKLDNLGHHSVFYSDQGYVWVTAEIFISKRETGYPNHNTPLRSWSLQKLDLQGKLLKEIVIFDILRKNDLLGLLHISTTANNDTIVKGDTLHLNDIDEFPVGMQSDLFVPGDLMISLRNINTVMVVDPASLKIKFLSTGKVLRQHDPDFMEGDRISVFDNRNLSPWNGAKEFGSRIIEINAKNTETEVVLGGKGLFYTAIMGVHQRLGNGNILVNSSGQGMVYEYTADGTLAWQYRNRYSNNRNGRIYNTILLPEYMDAEFFREATSTCTH